jgi:transcription-repair coupling factor (superfamily II helicase)
LTSLSETLIKPEHWLIDALTRLIQIAETTEGHDAPCIVLTTVNALLQRLPPRAAFRGRVLARRTGDTLAPDELTDFLVANGYLRAESVGEPGEYAVRGGLVDVFPPGEAEPLRLDFFGDELEAIRTFDPLTQRTLGKHTDFALRPVGEVFLDAPSIERFRSGYRETFGAVTRDDPLYEAVSAGRVHPGMEHWLPLFYDGLETLFDYLPGAPVWLDHQAEQARDVRFETITDFYQARESLQAAKGLGDQVYRPLPPAGVYLSVEDWQAALAERPTAQLSPYAAPEAQARVFDASGRLRRDFADARALSDGKLYDAVRDFVEAEQAAGRRVLVTGHSAGSLDRLANLLREHGLDRLTPAAGWPQVADLAAGAVGLASLGIEEGFGTPDLTVVTEQDILGERLARPAAKRRRPDNFLTEVSTLHDSDLVVHVDHGIGRYVGLETIDVHGAPHDCLRVLYHGGDKLFVPVENIEVLSRYGSEEAGVDLDRLGQGQWQSRKSRVKQLVREIAGDLIKLAAARALKQSEPLKPPEGIYEEFCARFAYPETDDQLRAIDETLDDLAAGRPMDRLICGDVGFGKTEVALRAAFVVAMHGWQVAFVVPTTLLARQHVQTLRERFAGLPLQIEQVSRLVPPKRAAEVKDGLRKGLVDIVVGTHSLLGKSIEFKDLGLLIVDEEQHFGVKQKERLKQLRKDVHVLTLTATPIPRTLQLGLTGVKDMSLIASPPVDRLAVRTFVLPYDPVVMREAILREYHRGGQVFYVCPRIEDLPLVEERVRKLVPEVRLRVAHGRLPARDQHHRSGPRYPERQYHDHPPRRHIRPVAALSTARAHRARQAAGLRLSDPAAGTPADGRRRAPPARDADPGYAGRRLSIGQPRPGHPRRREPAGRGAVGPYSRGRHRALPATAGGSGSRGEGRRGPRRARARLGSADQHRHAGADPRALRRRPQCPPRPLPPPVGHRGPCRDRRLRRRTDRPLRASAGGS